MKKIFGLGNDYTCVNMDDIPLSAQGDPSKPLSCFGRQWYVGCLVDFIHKLDSKSLFAVAFQVPTGRRLSSGSLTAVSLLLERKLHQPHRDKKKKKPFPFIFIVHAPSLGV